MDDQDLLKRYAKDGDDEAFTTLVERYIGMVYGTARRRTGNHE
jgi:DNA-directed RNA polymerase specialized sigma24 family protein